MHYSILNSSLSDEKKISRFKLNHSMKTDCDAVNSKKVFAIDILHLRGNLSIPTIMRIDSILTVLKIATFDNFKYCSGLYNQGSVGQDKDDLRTRTVLVPDLN